MTFYETYRFWTDLSIREIKFPFLRPWDVNNTIDDGMNNVYALRSKLSRE